MSDTFICGIHQAFIYERGGQVSVGELYPVFAIHWRRIRDDVSDASVTVPTSECCGLLEDVGCVKHELHVFRNGQRVWCGPITRIEFQHDVVQLFAEDLTWVAKRRALLTGYKQNYPNMGNVLDRVDWLLDDQCYSLYGNEWNVTLSPLYNPLGGEPKTSRSVNKYELYVWDDMDSYAEDAGVDYVCVNRTIYYHDTHLARWTLPTLDGEFISEYPRIVEYGNQLGTRAVYTDGRGYGVVIDGREPEVGTYTYIDYVTNNADDNVTTEAKAPDPAELDAWSASAERSIDHRHPPPCAVVIPANATLLPGAPWTIPDLIPGSWFKVNVTRLCRQVTEWHKLDELIVTEEAPNGEAVQFTSASAPRGKIDP